MAIFKSNKSNKQLRIYKIMLFTYFILYTVQERKIFILAKSCYFVTMVGKYL